MSSPASLASPVPGPVRLPRTRATGVAVGALIAVAILVLVLLFGGIPGISLNGSSSNGGSSTTHTVSFDETGLPTGTGWSVFLFDSSRNSTASSISFSEPNGEWPFDVPQASDYTAVPTRGEVVVNGSDVSVPILFSHYNVPLGSVFGWGPPINDTGTTTVGCPSSNGHYCYSIEIADASGGVGTSNIFLSLMNAEGAILTWPMGITISLISPANASAVATFNTTTSTWTLVPPYAGALSPGFTLVFYMANTSGGLLGLTVAATGITGFTGTVTSNPFS